MILLVDSYEVKIAEENNMNWLDLDLLIETVKVVSIQCSAIEQPNTLK